MYAATSVHRSRVKSLSYADRVLARLQHIHNGADLIILLNERDQVVCMIAPTSSSYDKQLQTRAATSRRRLPALLDMLLDLAPAAL